MVTIEYDTIDQATVLKKTYTRAFASMLWRTYNTCPRRPSRNIIISLKKSKIVKNVFLSLLSFLPLLQGEKFSQICFENSSLSKNGEKARSCNRWEQIQYKRLMGRQNPRNHYDEFMVIHSPPLICWIVTPPVAQNGLTLSHFRDYVCSSSCPTSRGNR